MVSTHFLFGAALQVGQRTERTFLMPFFFFIGRKDVKMNWLLPRILFILYRWTAVWSDTLRK